VNERSAAVTSNGVRIYLDVRRTTDKATKTGPRTTDERIKNGTARASELFVN